MELVICGGQRLFVSALAWALEQRGHRVATAGGPMEMLAALEEAPGSMLVFDLDAEPDLLDSVAAATRDRGAGAVALSSTASLDRRLRALDAGATICLDKGLSIDELVSRLIAVHEGTATVGSSHPPLPRGRADEGASHLGAYLTPREREVLQSLARGESTAELARRLDVRPATARTHIQNVLTKLCVHSRLAAVAYAVEHGLVEPDVHDDAPEGGGSPAGERATG